MNKERLCYWGGIAIVCFNLLLGTTSFMLIAPFYSEVSLARGVTMVESGQVIGSSFIVTMIISPLCGNFLYIGGSRRWISAGSLLCGVGLLGFGALQWLGQDGQLFFALSMVFRIVAAIGESIITPAGFTLATAQVEEHGKSKEFSLANMAMNSGFVLGPCIGGVLYEYGGFSAPFFTLGILMLLLGVVNCCVCTQFQKKSTPPGIREDCVSWWRVASSSHVPISIFALLISGMGGTWFSASLQPFLSERYQLTPGETGMVFMINGITFTVFPVVFGYMVAKGTPFKVSSF